MTPMQIAMLLSGYLLAAMRLLNAGRALWIWAPPWFQVLAPGLLVAIPTMAESMSKSQTWLDIVVNLVLIAGAVGTAVRGVNKEKEESKKE